MTNENASENLLKSLDEVVKNSRLTGKSINETQVSKLRSRIEQIEKQQVKAQSAKKHI